MINYTEQQINEWKDKADKYDQLDDKIANCYGKEDDNGEWTENNDDDIDLITIGEIAAHAFGWL